MPRSEVHFDSAAGVGTAPRIDCLRTHPGRSALAILSMGASAIHFAASPDHFGEWVPFGVAFAFLAWFQALWAATCLIGRARPWATAAIVINTGAIVVWIWSRTLGLPIGPDPGSIEPVGFADALSSAFEALIVPGLLAGGTPLAARLAGQPIRWRAAVTLVTVTVVALSLLALLTLAPQAMPMS